jgi:hypothetical protein
MGRFAVLVLTLALLAGCGGGDDGGGPTKDRFVADANRICREGEQRIAEVSREQQARLREAAGDRRVIAEVLETTTKAYEPYLERLRGLEAPSELQEGWTKFLDGVGEAFDLIPELADATRERDRETLAELTSEFSEIADDTRPFAQQNGLSDCLPD